MNYGIRIYFNQDTIQILCNSCNEGIDITRLVSKLKYYEVMKVPDDLYQAWKILILGFPNYAIPEQPELEHRIIKSAIEDIEE